MRHRLITGLALLLGLAIAAASNACFSERRETTAPPDLSAGGCIIPVNSPVVGATQALVAIRDFTFYPATIRVRAGTTVTWVDCEPEGTAAHTSTSDTRVWDSGSLTTGDTYSQTFNQPGQFPYHCEPHPFMRATVIVE